jgi:hypothetical protein
MKETEESRRVEVSSRGSRLRAWQRYWLITWAVLWGAGAFVTLLPVMDASWRAKAILAAVLGAGSYFFLESARSRVEFRKRVLSFATVGGGTWSAGPDSDDSSFVRGGERRWATSIDWRAPQSDVSF